MKIPRPGINTLIGCGVPVALLGVMASSLESPAISPVPGVNNMVEVTNQACSAALHHALLDEPDVSATTSLALNTAPADEMSLGQRFETSDDLGMLAESLVKLMENGDGEAAYYLYRIRELCNYRWDSDQTTETAALDAFEREYLDSLESAIGDPFLTDWMFMRERAHLKRAWQACPELPPSALDQASDDLIDVAATLGFPLAKALRAQRLLYIPSHSETPHPLASSLREAAMSRDPQTIYEIGKAISFSGLLGQRNKRLGRAWMLVACWHGLDCGPDGNIVRELICPNDAAPGCIPGVDLATHFNLWNPDEYLATFMLADRISHALQWGHVDDLDLYL